MRQPPTKHKKGGHSPIVMKLNTMLSIINGLEGSIDFPDNHGLQELLDHFDDAFCRRYLPAIWEMVETGKRRWPEYMLNTDVSRSLLNEFKPIYEVYQERMRYRQE